MITFCSSEIFMLFLFSSNINLPWLQVIKECILNGREFKSNNVNDLKDHLFVILGTYNSLSVIKCFSSKILLLV